MLLILLFLPHQGYFSIILFKIQIFTYIFSDAKIEKKTNWLYHVKERYVYVQLKWRGFEQTGVKCMAH